MRHFVTRIVLSAIVIGGTPVLGLAQETATAAPAAASDQAIAMQKTVYHVNYKGGDDGAGYKPALNNIRNQLDAVGTENADIRVVLHGDGINLLQIARNDQTLQGLIAGLKSEGVRFLVCNNTLTGRDINAETDLFDVWPEDIVPAGVVEIVRLQQEGFAYLRP
ncbi:hypothetical protein EYE42_10585 [Paracoccus subflavus]|uniref:Uncharacterized protein n=1 Tax=Paracoccus subflavus TaxID=2528244 RepID=A0A4Q9G5D4_9RHOB|nr:DsrE family protein [Paracoccus subflavus]TBN39464.1 hypothetical protein EYE42_10585 [Paracoccus subflavus]